MSKTDSIYQKAFWLILWGCPQNNQDGGLQAFASGHLGPFLGNLSPILVNLGPSWASLGFSLAHLGRSMPFLGPAIDLILVDLTPSVVQIDSSLILPKED